MVATPLVTTASASTAYEQEAKLDKLFSELQAGFKKMEGMADPNKQANILKDLTSKMQEAKRCYAQCSLVCLTSPIVGSLF